MQQKNKFSELIIVVKCKKSHRKNAISRFIKKLLNNELKYDTAIIFLFFSNKITSPNKKSRIINPTS